MKLLILLFAGFLVCIVTMVWLCAFWVSANKEGPSIDNGKEDKEP